MGYDVGVDMLPKVKAEADAAWIGIGIVVRDERKTSRVRKTKSDWGGRLVEVRSA